MSCLKCYYTKVNTAIHLNEDQMVYVPNKESTLAHIFFGLKYTISGLNIQLQLISEIYHPRVINLTDTYHNVLDSLL